MIFDIIKEKNKKGENKFLQLLKEMFEELENYCEKNPHPDGKTVKIKKISFEYFQPTNDCLIALIPLNIRLAEIIEDDSAWRIGLLQISKKYGVQISIPLAYYAS